MKFTTHSKLAVIAAVCVVALAGCAGNVKPETQVARIGTSVLGAATELQKGITASTDAGVLPVATAQTLTSYVEVISAKGASLGEALRAYHAATALDLKQVKASEIQDLIADMNATIGRSLGTALPDGALSQITALVGNVITAVGSVQAEVAKGLGS